MSEARAPLRKEKGFMAPPRTVGSWAEIRHSTPSTTPIPTIDDAPTVYSVPQAARGAELEEGGVPVEQQLDALAGQELAPLAVPLHVALAAAGPGRGQLLVDRRRPPRRGRARLARKVSEFGSMVVVRTGMGSV